MYRIKQRRKTHHKPHFDDIDLLSKYTPFDTIKSNALFEIEIYKQYPQHFYWLLVYIKHRKQQHLSREPREDLYRHLSRFIYYTQKIHFGKVIQFNTDKVLNRELAFIEYAEYCWDKPTPWITTVFQRKYHLIEAVLQCRLLNIPLPHNSSIINCDSLFIKYFVDYFKIERLRIHEPNLTYEEYYSHNLNHKYLYEHKVQEYTYWLAEVKKSLVGSTLIENIRTTNKDMNYSLGYVYYKETKKESIKPHSKNNTRDNLTNSFLGVEKLNTNAVKYQLFQTLNENKHIEKEDTLCKTVIVFNGYHYNLIIFLCKLYRYDILFWLYGLHILVRNLQETILDY